MIKVGLTGNRYSGKDIASNLFKKIGIPVFDADIMLKFLIQHNFEIQHNIRQSLGSKLFRETYIDFDYIKSNRILDSVIDCGLEWEIFNAYDKFQIKNANSIYTIFHSSILFERGWDTKMDYKISTFTSKSERASRCKKLTNNNYLNIYESMDSEMDDLEKNRLSDFVVNNYDDQDISDEINKIDLKFIDDYLSNERKTRMHGM